MKTLFLAFICLCFSFFVQAQTNHVVISQIYGAGGNTGASFKYDFIELFNPTGSTVNLSGWSLQYASSTSANWSSNKVDLTGSIGSGKYFLIQLNGGGAGSDLPAPDLSSANITMSATAGKVALVNTTTILSGNCPSFSSVIDFVGFGSGTDCRETANAPSPGTTTSIFRINNGCTDLDNNSSDFTAGAASPRNSASSANFCNGASVSVSSVSSSFFCVDGSLSANGTVQYTTNGAFSGAVFTAYLSDANGSFTAATVVGSATVSGVNPNGSISITVPATSPSSTNYRLRVDASNPSVTGSQSNAIEIINGAKNISTFSTSPNAGEMTLLWANPAGCFDEIMIVAKEGASVTGIPAGNGSAYVADANFNGNGTVFGGGKVVYKGTVSGPIITSLTNATSYFFKAFTRRGTQWSTGIEITDKPRLMPRPGEIIINQMSAGYNGVTDEYIELVNTTNKMFDLSELAIRYTAYTGNPGVAGGTLSGILMPYSYWLLSPVAVITVGQTISLPRDGSFADGFAASAGQIALIRKTDNAILDALGYGALTGGTYFEGSAAVTPPTNGGLKRLIDGVDNNNNSTDFSVVNNSEIDLRNSNSRIANTGALLTAGSFSRMYVTGNASLTGNVDVSDKIVLINGKLALGNYNLSANAIVGGTASSYIQTEGLGSFTINNIGSTEKKFSVGNSTYNPVYISNGDNLSWAVRVEDEVQLQNAGKAILRTWHVTPSYTPVSGANMVFEYNDGDARQTGTDFNKNAEVQIWNYHANNWQVAGSSTLPSGTSGAIRKAALTNWTQFSPFTIANTYTTLPVSFANEKLLQKEKSIFVYWTNLTEENVDRYEIEHSAEGKNFALLGTLTAVRNNNAKANYAYEDAHPSPHNFYRIKAIEKGGHIQYSRILSLNLNTSAPRLTIIPNPVKGNQISCKIENVPADAFQVRLYNTAGQIMYSESFHHPGGTMQQALHLPDIRSGYYTLEVTGKIKLTQTFIVW